MTPVNSNENYEDARDRRANEDDGQIMSWEEAKEIVESGRLELLHRKKSEQLKYRAFRANMTQKFGTIDNYLHKVVLNWHEKSFQGASTNNPPQEYFSSKIPSTHYNLRLNDFPYTIDSSISHYILWSKLPFKDLSDSNVKKEIDLFLKEKFPEEKEWLFFINPPQLQSIKNIWHGHIFVRDIPKQNGVK